MFIGYGKFTSESTVEVNGQTLSFSKAVVATGGSPQIPGIKGLKELFHEYIEDVPGAVPVLTNELVFNLVSQPATLGVIGTGAIGIELAQAFQRLGTQVVVFGRSGRILGKEDEDLSNIIHEKLEREGVSFRLKAIYDEVRKEDGKIRMDMMNDGVRESFLFDAILVAAGRTPNVSGLNLDAARVKYDTQKYGNSS